MSNRPQFDHRDPPDVVALCTLAMVHWEEAYDRLSQVQRYNLEREAAETAQRYARLSAYLSRRLSGGKHTDAVKAQNQAAAKVRQALGYTYKEAPITF